MSIQQQLIQFINEDLLSGMDNIDPDDNLLADDGIDSLGMLRLVAFIEATFAIKVAPDQFTIGNFRSVTVITDFLSRQQAQPGERHEH